MATQDGNQDGAPTGNAYVDSLIWGVEWDTTGGPVTYQFDNSSVAFTNQEKAAFQAVLANFAAVADITFQEWDGVTGAPNIRWTLTNSLVNPTHEVPDPILTSDSPVDGLFPVGFAGRASISIQGTVGFQTLLHEIGHGMGLAHPHDGGAEGDKSTFPGVNASDQLGDFSLNQSIWTVMSYNNGWTGSPPVFPAANLTGNNYGFAGTLMAFDIAALQAIYGANMTYKTGDDVYVLPKTNANGVAFWSSIWDAGGNDTISNAGSTIGATINLNDASLNPLTDGVNAAGYVSYNTGIKGGFTIANGAVIENAIGGSGADTITGNEFDNVIEGGLGNDMLDGGEGSETIGDTLTYASATAGVTVSLAITTQQTTGGGGNDTIKNFENLVGGKGNDTLTGDVEANYIYGGDGNDTIEGGAGADQLVGGGGATPGIDTVSYATSSGGVTIELSKQGSLLSNGEKNSAGTAQTGGDAEGDLLWGFENITGSANADNLTGDTGNNVINGGLGNDYIFGLEGNDTLNGEAGIDTFGGDLGIDTIDGGTQDPGGKDSINYTSDVSGKSIIIALGNGTANAVNKSVAGSFAAGDVIRNIETILGAAGNDTLTGNDLDNSFFGFNGFDTLSGGKGDDYLSGGNGDDLLIGGAGADLLEGDGNTDTVSYSASAQGVTIDLSLAAAQKGGDAEGDKLSSIEIVIGSSKNDSIKGSGADETFVGGAGADAFDGGGGVDTVSYAGETTGVTVNLTLGTSLGGNAAGDTFANIDNLTGSKGADTLTGDDNANIIDGGAGDDLIAGGLGLDYLSGGLGSNDTVSYAGSSIGVYIDFGFQGWVLNDGSIGGWGFAQGDADNEFIAGFENIVGSGHDDDLRGNNANNKIEGGAGNDSISGGTGNDILDGGAGFDTLDYSYVSGFGLTLTLGAWDKNTLTSAAASTSGVTGDVDSFKNFEAVIGGQSGSKLTGNAGDNAFFGGAGDDTLEGLGGADLLDGQGGFNTITYGKSASAVTVDLSLNNNGDVSLSGTQQGGDAAGDRLANVRNLTGSAFNDVLKGSNADETFIGGAGKDAFFGGGGVDTVTYAIVTGPITINLTTNVNAGGEALGDTFTNIQNIIATTANDLLTGDGAANYLFGANGNDTIEGGAGADELVGGLGIDTVSYANSSAGVTVNLALQGLSFSNGQKDTKGTASNGGDAAGDYLWGFENIIGSAFIDSLTGDSAANNIQGGGGDDTVNGGLGTDALDGGAGIDTVDYSYLISGKNLTVTLGAYDAKTFNVAQTSASGITGDTDSVKNFENIVGGAGNDKLTGNAGDNWLTGGAGADILIGGAGADRLHGNVATSVDLGNPGDTADYSASNAGITIAISNASYSLVGEGGHAEGDILAGINNIIGSNFNDFISGDTVFGVLSGLGGDDIIRAANHSSGTNVLDGGAHGTAGDTIDYSWASNVITLTIALSNTNNAVVNVDSNGAGATQIKNFENIIGGAGDDILTGNNVANVIEGGAGADTLTGGGGVDTISYAGSKMGVNISLENAFQNGSEQQKATFDGIVANGDAAGDILQGFTHFIGSAKNDIVQGNSTRAETIFGRDGNDDLSGGDGNFGDKLDGGKGDDNLYGGAGGDTLIGGDGADWAAYGGASGITVGIAVTLGKNGTSTGFAASGGEAAGDTLIGIENVSGSDFDDKITGNELANELWGNVGNDALNGNAGIDTLVGGDDNDTLTGGADADILDGRDGNDTINYALSAAGVTVNLTAQGTYKIDPMLGEVRDTAGPIQTGGDALGDTLWSIENIIGSAKNDVLTANGDTQFLDGSGGRRHDRRGDGSKCCSVAPAPTIR